MLADILERLHVADDPRIASIADAAERPGEVISSNPTTAEPLASVRLDTAEDYERIAETASKAFRAWRRVPGPVRGQAVRAIADELRKHKQDLGALVTMEVGKIRSEGEGEVQETIDIADFAVGLSRQLYGLTMPSERADHRIEERWHPLGPVGVITAFNFPNAVWGWNAMIGAVCGDSIIWKPSLYAPLTAIATNAICARVLKELDHPDIFQLVIGTDDAVGERLVADKRVPLISATGSCRMGRIVSQKVAARLGKCLLELGGNNAVIFEPDANLSLAIPSTVFGAVGTAGQRCTSTRRLLCHESIADEVVEKFAKAYEQIRLGDPLDASTHVGPLIHEHAVEQFLSAMTEAQDQGGELIVGGGRAEVEGLKGHFVQPTIIRAPADNNLPIALEETFAPILYVFTYKDLDEAIEMHNGVDQGLSSAIFSESMRAAERFTSESGSDCGLAYVNLGTSGAEIGGAFGGEKDTGGGRESGSDAWKAYMRRQTVSIHSGSTIQLAQGIRFDQ